MCCRTLSKLWDIESPKHASFAAFARGGEKKKKPLPVRFTLISAWNQKRERMEGEDAVVFIVAAEVALAHTWPFVAAAAASTGAVYVASFVRVCVCVWSRPLAWCFHGCFHWGFPLKFTSLPTPPRAPAVYLESASASGESGGPFEACWLTLLFCCLGRFFFGGGGGVTQLCIVFYSLALLGVHPKFGSAESTK